MIRRYFPLVLRITVCALFVIPTAVQACPSCKLVDDPIAQGFKWEHSVPYGNALYRLQPDWRRSIFFD